MLSSGYTDIDAAVVLNETSNVCTNHRYKDQIEFSPLWAVDWKHLIMRLSVQESLCDRILLGVVRSDHINGVLGELLDWNFRVSLVQTKRLLEQLQAMSDQILRGIDLCLVPVWGLFAMLAPLLHINKQEGRLWVHELLFKVGLIAALDAILVEKHVRYLHQGWVHAVLRVQKAVRMTSLNQPRVERGRSIHPERIRRP